MAPRLAAVECLALRRAVATQEFATEFVNWVGVEGLTELVFTGCLYHSNALDTLVRSRCMTEIQSLNLSGRGLRQYVAEFDPAGVFVVSEFFSNETLQFVCEHL